MRQLIKQANHQLEEAGDNLSFQKLLTLKNQGLIKSAIVASSVLKPLYDVVSRTLYNLETIKV